MMIDSSRVRDISPETLDENGRLRILPSAFWGGTTRAERALFGHRHGLYGLPTVELVAHVRRIIGDRSAIEIGAGSGVLAEALDIPATDNRMHDMPKYRAIYDATGQPTTTYGPNVVTLDAASAVSTYEPDVVIGSWITHKWEPDRHWAGGNEIGVDEGDLLKRVAHYVIIGNKQVHRDKAIWNLPHTCLYPDFVYSRSSNDSPDFLAIWRGGKFTG